MLNVQHYDGLQDVIVLDCSQGGMVATRQSHAARHGHGRLRRAHAQTRDAARGAREDGRASRRDQRRASLIAYRLHANRNPHMMAPQELMRFPKSLPVPFRAPIARLDRFNADFTAKSGSIPRTLEVFSYFYNSVIG